MALVLFELERLDWWILVVSIARTFSCYILDSIWWLERLTNRLLLNFAIEIGADLFCWAKLRKCTNLRAVVRGAILFMDLSWALMSSRYCSRCSILLPWLLSTWCGPLERACRSGNTMWAVDRFRGQKLGLSTSFSRLAMHLNLLHFFYHCRNKFQAKSAPINN